MYLDYYGLKENPFNVTSDPSFLYLSRTHREALDHLKYGITQRKGFVEVTGEVGAGKTTLCRALLNQLQDNVKTSYIFNPGLPETQLLEAILEDLGMTPVRRSKVKIIKQLNEFLLEQLKEDNNVVLIIDEAQNLRPRTLETIRMLSNLETEKEKLLQIILVGQPELRDKLRDHGMLQLRQRISIRFHITALEESEIDMYIMHRLNVASIEKNIEITDGALKDIYDYTKGIPRVINVVCDKALLLGYVHGTRLIEKGIIEQSIEEIEGQFSFTR
jgi:general secretion pathway protein A